MTRTEIDEAVAEQVERQGVGCVRVEDGHVFVFTSEALEKLLEQSEEHGKVIVFVKHTSAESLPGPFLGARA
jgi:thiamine phosphate synthase YjbQ (UPF0047 family)